MLTNCEISIKNKFLNVEERLEEMRLTDLGTGFMIGKVEQYDIFLPIPIEHANKSYISSEEWQRLNEEEHESFFTMQKGDIIVNNRTGKEYLITNLTEKNYGTETMRHWHIICK